MTAEDTSWITLAGHVAASPRALTIEDILKTREVHEPTLSPDGRQVAFLVRQAFAECNCYRTALYLAGSEKVEEPRKLIEEEAISNLRWMPDGHFLTYLSTRSGSSQVWRVSMAGGPSAQVFAHARGDAPNHDGTRGSRSVPPAGVEQYEWSIDGMQIAFTTRPGADSALLRRAIESGVIYNDEQMWVVDILHRQWTREPTELWVYEMRSHRQRRLWRAPAAGATSWSHGISSLVWAPEGDRIAFSYDVGINPGTGERNHDVGVVDVLRSQFRPLVTTDSMYEDELVWSRDGARIAFHSRSIDPVDLSGARSVLGILDVAGGATQYALRGASAVVRRLWWTADGSALGFEGRAESQRQYLSGLYQTELRSVAPRRLTAAVDHISECSAPVGERVACVRENSNVPSDPAVVDLRTGDARVVANTNPELRDLILAPVTGLQWRNKYGTEANGYLLRPYGYERGRRYPLLLILYGFEGRFVTAAEWITSYPAQVFAREGFAVLLCNAPSGEERERYDFDRAGVVHGYGPLASLESAVRMLGELGLVDTTRVGLMGWSMGGFWTEFALTRSSLFRVASVGNNGDYNPGAYWFFGQRAYRTFAEKLFGGPPYGPALSHWLALSPAFNASRVRASVLLEAQSDEAILALEMFTALRRHRVPVELVVYPDAGHVFRQPAHRLASMQRNLEWFGFWLEDREYPDPSKREQYARWRKMRDLVKQAVVKSP